MTTTSYAEALIQRLIAQGLTIDRKHPATTNVRAKWHIQASGAPSFATPSETKWAGHGRVGMSTLAELVPASLVR